MPRASSSLRLACLAVFLSGAGLSLSGCNGSKTGSSPVKGPTFEQTVQQKFEGLPDTKPTEKELTNSIGMKLLLVEPGSFQMGWAKGDSNKVNPLDYEQFGGPLQQVTISRPFYLGQTEVTQAQYQKVMDKNPSRYQAGTEYAPADVDPAKLPVDSVSWDDAVAFCKALSDLPEEKAAGRVYTLPTEAQWEYACRAGSEAIFASGDTLDPEFGVSGESGTKNPLEVGSRKPNAWGFHDMHGNVWEWCADGRRQLAESPVTDPTTANETSKERMVRGGSFRQPTLYARSNFRNYINKSAGMFDFGFRVAVQQ